MKVNNEIKAKEGKNEGKEKKEGKDIGRQYGLVESMNVGLRQVRKRWPQPERCNVF